MPPRRRVRKNFKTEATKLVVLTTISVLGYLIKVLQTYVFAQDTFGWIFGRLLLVAYIGLWIFATVTAVQATRILYGRLANQSRMVLMLYVLLSVTTFIAGFALAYLDISTADPAHAFSTKEALTPV